MNDEELTQAGMNALDNFMEGFNSRDPSRWVESLNFPHARTAPGVDSRIIQNADDYIKGFDYQSLVASGWEASAWDYRQILHVSTNKIHAAGQWSRFTHDGTKILTTPVSYIITRDEDKWGVQSRFAVDSIRDDDMEETERPAFKIVEAFAQCYNNNNMRGCSTLLNYPHVEVGPGQIMKTEQPGDFTMQRQGYLEINSLMAIQSGKKAVNLAVEVTITDDNGSSRFHQGIIQITHKNDHPGINAWSLISPTTDQDEPLA